MKMKIFVLFTGVRQRETGAITAKKYERTQSDKYAIYLNLQNKSGISLRNDTEELIELTADVCKTTAYAKLVHLKYGLIA